METELRVASARTPCAHTSEKYEFGPRRKPTRAQAHGLDCQLEERQKLEQHKHKCAKLQLLRIQLKFFARARARARVSLPVNLNCAASHCAPARPMQASLALGRRPASRKGGKNYIYPGALAPAAAPSLALARIYNHRHHLFACRWPCPSAVNFFSLSLAHPLLLCR